jgi:hypothetical protein
MRAPNTSGRFARLRGQVFGGLAQAFQIHRLVQEHDASGRDLANVRGLGNAVFNSTSFGRQERHNPYGNFADDGSRDTTRSSVVAECASVQFIRDRSSR